MGRNLVKFKKKLMSSCLILKHDVIIVILTLFGLGFLATHRLHLICNDMSYEMSTYKG